MSNRINPTSSQYAAAQLIERILESRLSWYFIFRDRCLNSSTTLPTQEKHELIIAGLELMGYDVNIYVQVKPWVDYQINILDDGKVILQPLDRSASCSVDINSH